MHHLTQSSMPIKSIMLLVLITQCQYVVASNNAFFAYFSFHRTEQPLGQWSNCCKYRKFIIGHIPMRNYFAVYFLCFLLALYWSSFISKTPNKNQEIEQKVVHLSSPGPIFTIRGPLYPYSATQQESRFLPLCTSCSLYLIELHAHEPNLVHS